MTSIRSGNILAIFAHPDDESFFCAGTLARYAAAGHRVHLICATRGERGELLHPDLNPARHPTGEARGQLRQKELEAACAVLGIEAPTFLDYKDSGYPAEVALQNADAFIHEDPLRVAERLLECFGRTQPEVVITFDPYGYYGHVDHLVVHRAATAAFWAADCVMDIPPKRLFYPIRANAKCLARISMPSIAAQIEVSAFGDQIAAAISAHRSQVGPQSKLEQLRQDEPEMFQTEQFLLGGLRGGFPNTPVTDLFAA